MATIEVIQKAAAIIAPEQKTAAQIAVEARTPATVIEVPRDAPPPPPENTASNVVILYAGEVINGGKAVVIETDGRVYVYDITNEDHYGKTVGIAKQGALQNETVEIYTGGQAYEAGSGWQAGRLYYVSANGTPSINYPLSGITKVIGVGIAPDTILLNSSLEFITI